MKILIVDDDKLITYALKTIIDHEDDMEVVGLGHHAEDALRLYREHQPDVALLDIRMGDSNGLDAFQNILQEFPEAKVVFLTTFSDDAYIREALTLGAKGYLLKSEVENIVPALRTVLSGQNVYESKVFSKIPDILAGKKPSYDPSLTEKEIDLLHCIAEGYNNKEIAARLYLSEGTVRNYISVILEKLSLRDRTQLAVYYLKGEAK